MPQDLKVAKGEKVLLSPKSAQFADQYHRNDVSDIDEVRKLLGVTVNAEIASQVLINSKRSSLMHVEPKTLSAQVPASDISSVSVKEQLSADNHVATQEINSVYQAAYEYVYGDKAQVVQWKPAIDNYLKLRKAFLLWIEMNTIEIADGGTLIIDPTTHLLSAYNIKLFGSGKIVCEGNVTIRVNNDLRGYLR